VCSLAQDKDTLLIGCDNDSLMIYDVQLGKVIDEWTDFVPQLSQIGTNGDTECVLVGTKDGEVHVFSQST
jgi:hypothetical protein